MRVFFLSEKLCALSANGLYLGSVDGFERSVELDPADEIFIELKPIGFLPVRFVFNEQFLLSPPPQVALYYTRTGLAVYCRGFLREDASMRVLWQERLEGTRFTLYMQGKVQLSMESGEGFFLITLPDAFESCKLHAAGEFYLLETEGAFLLFTRRGEIVVRSDGTVLERGRTVRAEVPFHDSMEHSALIAWEDGKLISCTVRTRREPTAATFAVALFESARIGADCTPFLSDALCEKADSLKEFLGNYLSVVLTEKPNEVGLVYPRKENIFDVRYFRVTVEGGKISNIAPME